MQKYKVRKGGVAKLVFAAPLLSNTQHVFYLKEITHLWQEDALISDKFFPKH